MGGSTVEVSDSAGLFEDKKWCRMVEEDRCVLCNGGKVEDVKHFVLKFEQDRVSASGKDQGNCGSRGMIE